MKADAQVLLESVREVLWTHWDPIGVNAGVSNDSTDPDAWTDEYDSYAFGLMKSMQSGADEATLTKRLGQLSKDAMCLAPNIQKNAEVAARLIKLMAKER